jgi:hypothetical protein
MLFNICMILKSRQYKSLWIASHKYIITKLKLSYLQSNKKVIIGDLPHALKFNSNLKLKLVPFVTTHRIRINIALRTQ